MKIRYVYLLLFILVSGLSANEKNVLLLNSYHQNLLWTDNITKAVVDVLEPQKNHIELHIESMDTKKYYSKNHYNNLYKLYKEKYSNTKFDLILASDNNALTFLKKNKKELFGDVSVLFCGVNNFTPSMLEGKSNYTGVAEILSIEENIELIQTLHPNVKNIYVVNDYLKSGIAWAKDIDKQVTKYKDKLNFIYNKDMSFEELNNKFQTLGNNSVVLFGVYFADKNGLFITPKMRTKLFKDKNVPIYALLNFDMLKGAIGGMLTGGYYQGYPMGQMAKQILLDKKDIKEFDVVIKGSNRFVFNYNALKHNQIKIASLPKDSIVLNKPITFYTQYKYYIFASLFVFVVLVVIILILIRNNKQKEKLEKELEYFNRTLETKVNEEVEKNIEKTKEQDVLLSLFDKGDSVLFKWNNDENWSVDYLSSSITKLLNYEQDEFLSQKIAYASCVHPDDLDEVIEEVVVASSSSESYFKHNPYRVITKNGDIKWVLDYTVIVRDNDQNITHYIGYITDITREKENERLLAEQAKLVSMGEMIGNIAHQWRQPLSVISSGATGLMLQHEYDELDDEFFYKTCNMINDNAQYLSKTIDDFKNFVKGEKKKVNFSLKDDIDSFLHLVEGSIKNHHITIVSSINDDIYMYGHPNELVQCFINIFNNSKDALKENKVENRYIFITTLKNEKNIIIKFRDNANGVPNELLSKIFEPYFTTKHQSQGTGLGLHMTYQFIVESMNGTIIAQNIEYQYKEKNYKGAEFIITVPLNVKVS